MIKTKTPSGLCSWTTVERTDEPQWLARERIR